MYSRIWSFSYLSHLFSDSHCGHVISPFPAFPQVLSNCSEINNQCFIIVDQSLSCIQFFVTPCTAVCQAFTLFKICKWYLQVNHVVYEGCISLGHRFLFLLKLLIAFLFVSFAVHLTNDSQTPYLPECPLAQEGSLSISSTWRSPSRAFSIHRRNLPPASPSPSSGTLLLSAIRSLCLLCSLNLFLALFPSSCGTHPQLSSQGKVHEG